MKSIELDFPVTSPTMCCFRSLPTWVLGLDRPAGFASSLIDGGVHRSPNNPPLPSRRTYEVPLMGCMKKSWEM